MENNNLENLNYNVPFTKADGCVLINAKDWQDNTTQLIQAYNMKGERCISYINKVLKTNYNKEIYGDCIKEGDLIFITKQASRVSYLKPFKLAGESNLYANVHVLQIVGTFSDSFVSYDTFSPVFNKVFMKKIIDRGSSLLDLGDSSQTVFGEVLKVGTNGFDENWNPVPLHTQVGQKVLVRDNSFTELYLDGELYIATDDDLCLGYFDGDICVDNLSLFGDNIIMERYNNRKVEGSSLFYKAEGLINDNVSDVYESYDDTQYRIIKVGPEVTKVKEGDTVVVNPDFINYVTIGGDKYYTLKGTQYIVGIFN